jgi:hypothetical protein
MTISARGLSFCAITFSMICITAVEARTVSVLADLLNWMSGCTPSCGTRMMLLMS